VPRTLIMQARNTLQNLVKCAVLELQKKGNLPDVKVGEFKIEVPSQAGHGDYATAIALQIGAFSGKKPKRLAQILAKKLAEDKNVGKIASKIEVVAPGFVNFHLSGDFLRKELLSIATKPDFGVRNIGRGKKINLEFVSVNPTGQLHVGHGRSAFYGDVLARVLTSAGYNVTREYYVNNARQSAQIRELGKTALKKGTSYKGPYLDKKIRILAKRLKQYKSFEAAGYFLADHIQRDIKVSLKKMGIAFDVWTKEDDLYKQNKVGKALKLLTKKKLVYDSEGARWLKTSRYGDSQDQVIVRSSGEQTYFLSDIAYHYDKASRSFDRIIDIWGADHQGHAKRMKAAMRIFGIRDLTILIAQLVRIRGGAKLSKRKGNIVTLEDLVDTIGLDAARYFYLTKSLDSQMEIDIALARLKDQNNPIFYIQYTHARICSIMRKSKEMGHIHNLVEKHMKYLTGDAEQELMRKLAHFSEVVEDSARDYQVHRLTTYLLELSQLFNQFYRDHKVLTDEIMVRDARLTLTIATGAVMRECLELLGIEAPEKL